jgi:hypothetical protein
MLVVLFHFIVSNIPFHVSFHRGFCFLLLVESYSVLELYSFYTHPAFSLDYEAAVHGGQRYQKRVKYSDLKLFNILIND